MLKVTVFWENDFSVLVDCPSSSCRTQVPHHWNLPLDLKENRRDDEWVVVGTCFTGSREGFWGWVLNIINCMGHIALAHSLATFLKSVH